MISSKYFGTKFRKVASIFFLGMEFRVISSSTERFGTEFQDFCSVEQLEFRRNNPFVSSIQSSKGIIFLSEIPNPNDFWMASH